MNYALKFPGRTRQKKHLFSFFIMLILLIPLVPSISPLGVQASESITSSVASPDVAGSAASEEETVDSFDVHPINRWDITDGFSDDSVSNSILNLTDIGDGSSDNYIMIRDLRDLSGTIEIRFQIQSNTSDSSTSDFMYFYLTSADTSKYIRLSLVHIDTTSINSFFRLTHPGGTVDKTLTTDEDVEVDNWYIYRIDYDLLESKIRLRLFFDNNSKIFDYVWQDIDDTVFPDIFSSTDLILRFFARTTEINDKLTVLIDYVNAPFKEREWIRQATSGDADWLESSYAINRIQDDIPDDEEFWNLVSPYFDSVTGHMVLQTNTVLDPGIGGEDIEVKFFINGVDFDDGALHPLFGVIARIRSAAGGGATGVVEIFDAVRGVRTIRDMVPENDTIRIDVDFSISTFNDRKELIWEVSAVFNEDTTDINLAGGHIPARTTFVDIRDEFVLQTDYIMDFDDNIEVIAGFTDISILERDIFSDIGGFLDDVIGFGEDVVSGGADLFGILFRWLGSLLVGALGLLGEIFTTAIGVLQSALSVALGLVETAVGLVEDAIDALGLILDDIVTALGELAAGIIAALVTAMDDVIDAAITQLLAVASDVADFLFAAIDFLLDLLLTILDELWALLVGIAFFVWDAVGLPDILALGNELLAYFIELIAWTITTFLEIVQLAADLSWLILVLWWLWAIPFQWARANFDPLGGIANFIEVYFYDALPWKALGFHIYIPQGLVFTLWLILLLPADFAIFGALGL